MCCVQGKGGFHFSQARGSKGLVLALKKHFFALQQLQRKLILMFFNKLRTEWLEVTAFMKLVAEIVMKYPSKTFEELSGP